MRTWPLRRWLVAAAVTALAALVIGIPTGVVPTPFYSRMTPVVWWNYPVWAISSVLEGLLIASYVRQAGASPTGQWDGLVPSVGPVAPRGETPWKPLSMQEPRPVRSAAERPRTARAPFAGVASALAVGCPICNKVVVFAIGMSGALSYWAPVQPVLGAASVALLSYALVRRLRAAAACPIPS